MLIRIEDISFTYPGAVKALEGVSLCFNSGERVALVGENGSGKTTLARHLNGLLRPQSGTVWIGDWLTIEHSPAQLAQRVAYVFQNPDEQLFRQRVWDEVAFGPQNMGCSTALVHERVADALQTVGLLDLAQQNPRDLGYSSRKRVALASALAMQTPLLVLDEPSAGLDFAEQQQLGKVISMLQGQDKTILMISHDLDFIAENMDRMVLLHQGRVVLDKEIHEFIAQQTLLQHNGIVPPQMVRLSQSLNRPTLALTIDQFIKGYKYVS